jgi:hypothetical protein
MGGLKTLISRGFPILKIDQHTGRPLPHAHGSVSFVHCWAAVKRISFDANRETK